MHWIDWAIVAGFILFALGIGVYFTRKASSSTADFFIAGRSLPWWIAGTSIVATTFSTDTPLYVTQVTRESGVSYNWIWWGILFGSVATIFFFARLWRRTEQETDVAFIQLRYQPGVERDLLRVFHAMFGGILVNVIVIASVSLAARTLITVLLGWEQAEPIITLHENLVLTNGDLTMIVLAAIALIYSTLSGLYGVAYTDLLQFILAMIGAVWLAIAAYTKAQAQGGIPQMLDAAGHDSQALTTMFPDLSQAGGLVIFTFAIWVGVNWWDNAPGRFYIVQRLLATRTERDSMLAFLWFCFCNYVLRAWPWIVVALVSLAMFPNLEDHQSAYPKMIDALLGPGIKGITVAALLAAYMSTIDTQLNWGASYLVNDIYRSYIHPKQSEKYYVMVARLAMIGLLLIALMVLPQLGTIKEAYQYLAVITGGIGTVIIARWYWWRVNAWSEISAIISVLVIANVCAIYVQPSEEQVASYAQNNQKHVITDYYWALRQAITIACVTAIWVTVTFLTTSKPTKHIETFHRKMRIPGPGWRVVAEQTQTPPLGLGLWASFVGWAVCCTSMICFLLGSGEMLFGRWLPGCIYLAIAVSCLALLLTRLKGVFSDEQPADSPSTP